MKTKRNGKYYWSEIHQTWGVFRTTRRHPKTQEIMVAANYGRRAWFIPIDELGEDDGRE